MTDGLMLPPGGGTRIPSAGMTLKIGAERSATWSMFEAEVAPGFDVGAHRHAAAEEVFYVLDGELDLLAFEPETMTAGDWRAWTSGDRGHGAARRSRQRDVGAARVSARVRQPARHARAAVVPGRAVGA
ncbi:cupin domain-containing protein [Dactylosporangium darangshiense]|uniref:cupin domain-containing protein n=1 Tax=Dactylosporangium darangshiense TaxID=579108 RepID=UPI003634C2A9